MSAAAYDLMQTTGQGLPQVVALLTAFVLTAMIGLERELHRKSAGVRTHTLVGVGAALFMITSKYGFGDVLAPGTVMLDPSRIAAQIVSGIGFIGAGLIFVRRDAVRGLTTAATVWVAAAVGTAAGAGLLLLAALVTAMHFVVTFFFPLVTSRLPHLAPAGALVRVSYEDGRGVLRDVATAVTRSGFAIEEVTTRRPDEPSRAESLVAAARAEALPQEPEHALVELTLALSGHFAVAPLVGELTRLPGVVRVSAGDLDDAD